MNRREHLQSARDFLTALTVLETMPRQSQAVAEMVWGATVAAVSAADPEHESSGHFAPNRRWSFRQAAQRIASPELTLPELEDCLENNQGFLHTHFYHGGLTATNFMSIRNDGLAFVRRIIALAEQSLP